MCVPEYVHAIVHVGGDNFGRLSSLPLPYVFWGILSAFLFLLLLKIRCILVIIYIHI